MLEKNATNPNTMGKVIAVVRQLSEEEKRLRDIQKREETLMNERYALNSAKKEGFQQGFQEGLKQGKQQVIEEFIEKLKKNGFTDKQIKQIKDLFSE